MNNLQSPNSPDFRRIFTIVRTEEEKEIIVGGVRDRQGMRAPNKADHAPRLPASIKFE
jgi:hypothetical protein